MIEGEDERLNDDRPQCRNRTASHHRQHGVEVVALAKADKQPVSSTLIAVLPWSAQSRHRPAVRSRGRFLPPEPPAAPGTSSTPRTISNHIPLSESAVA